MKDIEYGWLIWEVRGLFKGDWINGYNNFKWQEERFFDLIHQYIENRPISYWLAKNILERYFYPFEKEGEDDYQEMVEKVLATEESQRFFLLKPDNTELAKDIVYQFMEFIDNIQDTQMFFVSNQNSILDFQRKNGEFPPLSISYEQELNYKISGIPYRFKPIVIDGNIQYRVVPDFQVFEHLLYQDLINYVNHIGPLVRCAQCKSIIEFPTSQQISAVKRGRNTTHDGECRRKYNIIEATERKRNSRKKKKEKEKINS